MNSTAPLPRDLTDKPVGRDDLALASTFAPAGSDTEKQLLSIWESVLDIRGLGIDDDFFELNGQSFAAVTLFSEMERVLGKMPPVSALLKSPTVRLMAGQIDALRHASARHLIVPFRTSGDRPPLFVIHGGGGSVLVARNMLPYLDPQQPLYGIQARGLVEGEAPHRNLDAMVSDYLGEIRRIQPRGPYYLAGFCIGTLIAYEMAQRITASGDKVQVIIGVDPNFNRELTPWLYWRKPDSLPSRMCRIFSSRVWRAYMLARRLQGHVPLTERAATTRETKRRYRAIEAGSLAAFKSYRPRPYGGKMLIFCSGERKRRLADPVTGMPALGPGIRVVVLAPRHLDFFGAALETWCTAAAAELNPS